MFAMGVKENSAASTHMTNIDEVLGMQTHLAHLCNAMNLLLPDEPIFPQLCSDRTFYTAHMPVNVSIHRLICAICTVIEGLP